MSNDRLPDEYTRLTESGNYDRGTDYVISIHRTAGFKAFWELYHQGVLIACGYEQNTCYAGKEAEGTLKEHQEMNAMNKKERGLRHVGPHYDKDKHEKIIAFEEDE